MTTKEQSIALIKELLAAKDNQELQKLISLYLPQMDNTFFSVLTQAAVAESTHNPTVGARLTSLAQVLLPLRTLI